MFAKLSTEKGSSDDCHAIEKAQSKRTEAMELIALTCKRHPDIKTAEDLVPLVYRIKQGIEV